MSNVLAVMAAAGAVRDAQEAASPYHLRYLGDRVLTTPCFAVEPEHREQLPALIDAMTREMVKNRHPYPSGVGISANQVGSLLAVALVQVQGDVIAMVNPRLVHRAPGYLHGSEGCLSIPGFTTSIARAPVVTVQYQDATTFESRMLHAGNLPVPSEATPQVKKIAAARQFEARCVQHELDHLEGRLIVDGATRQQRRNAERCVEKACGR